MSVREQAKRQGWSLNVSTQRKQVGAPTLACAACSDSLPRRGRGRLGIIALALAGYLLFAHGCHGDEDNELFNAVRTAGLAANGR